MLSPCLAFLNVGAKLFSLTPLYMKPLARPIALLTLLTLLLTGCSLERDDENDYKSDVPMTDPIPETDADAPDSAPSTPTALPAEINLDMTFYSQAPTGNWEMPYQEACEEASLLLAYHYVTGQDVSVSEFETALLDIVDWEVETFGQYVHTDVEQTAQILEEHLGYTHYEIVDDPTVDQLKGYLAKGYPVVFPAAGRYLGNPYFTGEGPVYHMLVLKGYDSTHFITNDVGTRRGENFIYTYDTMMFALHEWADAADTDPEGILEGDARVLVLFPESVSSLDDAASTEAI